MNSFKRFMSLSLIFALVFLVSWSVGRPASDLEEMDSTDPEWMDSELSRVKLAILTELGLHVSPEQAEHLDMLPKSNISDAEYRRGYGEYMRRVRLRKLEEKGLVDYGRRNRQRNAKRFVQIVNPNTLHTYDNIESRIGFNVNLNLERRFHLRIKRAVIELPMGCYFFDVKRNDTHSGSVDVTDKLRSWVTVQAEHLEDSFGVTVFCNPKTGTSPDSLSQTDDLSLTTLKVISTELPSDKLGTKHRGKRSLSLRNYERRPSVRSRDCDKTRHGKTCCRKSMKVNFEELKIRDLIYEPKEFDAHVCNGRCNARRVPYATTHAMLQQTLHQAKGKSQVPRPCCTPTKLRHLDVLHSVPGTNILKITILPNAIVEECSCS